MTYVISDLHGYPIEKFKMLLEKANFCEDDFLYILGDVIDRNGDGGVGILRWLLSQPNVQLILGNHEAMLLACAFLFDEITDDSIADFDSEKIEILSNYQLNGGDVTLKSLAKLNKESPETVVDILNYLRDCPLYEAVTAGGGGTDFQIIFEYVDQHMKEKEPNCIIILTDGYAPFPKEELANDIPVLWLINNHDVTPPWGKVARFSVRA